MMEEQLTTIAMKQAAREKIAADVEVFLQKGGKIKRIDQPFTLNPVRYRLVDVIQWADWVMETAEK